MTHPPPPPSTSTSVAFFLELLHYLGVVSGTVASFFIARGCRSLRVPPVLGMLGFGFALRHFFPSDDLERISDPVVDFALAGIGLEIGSHLNEASLGPVLGHMLRFMAIFIAVVMFVFMVGIYTLLPEMLPFAALAASIAVERSSPECLHGVAEARAKGPFSNSLMCIAAMQDIAAVVMFVISSAAIGATSAVDGIVHLFLMFACTFIAVGAALLAARVIYDPNMCLLIICALLVTIAEYTPSELLLSAVLTGIALNYRKSHAISVPLQRLNGVISAMLFTWMGYRMNIMNYLGLSGNSAVAAVANKGGHHDDVVATVSVGMVVGLYLLRLTSLFFGSAVASIAVGWRQHAFTRWMGLVTQLAIALSLVQRGERAFPKAAPLMRAYGGSVLCSVITGPALLQFALSRSGEANNNNNSSAANSVAVEETSEDDVSEKHSDTSLNVVSTSNM